MHRLLYRPVCKVVKVATNGRYLSRSRHDGLLKNDRVKLRKGITFIIFLSYA